MTPVLFAALALAVALVVVAPLVRRGPPPRSRAEYERAVYRDQVRELEEDAARGVLTAEQHQAARTEVDRRLLASARTDPAPAHQGRLPPLPAAALLATAISIALFALYLARQGLSLELAAALLATAIPVASVALYLARYGRLPQWPAAVVLAIAIPATSVALYLWQGSPAIPGAPLASRTDAGRPVLSPAQMTLIAEQQAAVDSDPANAEAWAILGRGYLLAGRYQDSVDAFGAAIELGANGPDEQMGLVEALMERAGGLMTPEVQRAIDAALAADPAHAAARFYQGEAHAQAGRMQAAFEVWMALAADTPSDAPWLQMLRARLEKVSAELGIDLAAVLPEPAPALPEGVADLSPDERMAMIEGMVAQLAARLAEEPEDFDGWTRLARSYRVLGRFNDAADAVAAAAALRSDDPATLLQQAAIAVEGTEPGDPIPEFAAANLERVLAAEPFNAEALLFAALVAENRGDAAAARGYWGRMLALMEPGSEVALEIQIRIEAIAPE